MEDAFDLAEEVLETWVEKAVVWVELDWESPVSEARSGLLAVMFSTGVAGMSLSAGPEMVSCRGLPVSDCSSALVRNSYNSQVPC